MTRNVIIPLLSLIVVIIAIFTAPVAGLSVVSPGASIWDIDSLNITDIHGYADVQFINDQAGIHQGGTITIDTTNLNQYVASGNLTTANVRITPSNSSALWTATFSPDSNTLTLTSTSGPTEIGDSILVTFTGAAGNPWVANTHGADVVSFTATIPGSSSPADTLVPFSFVIQTGGLQVTNGADITEADGATSALITITSQSIPEDGTINIDITNLNMYATKSGGYLDATNVIVSSDATHATWNFAFSPDGNILILTSTGGSTEIGKTINVTFTGAGDNPWSDPSTGPPSWDTGAYTIPVPVIRNDGLGQSLIKFFIDTGTPGHLSITNGAKITTLNGATSPIFTITDAPLAQGGTVSIDIKGLNPLVATGQLTTDNIKISPGSGVPAWTPAISADGNTLVLTSSGGSTGIGDTVTVTFTGATGNPWITNTGGERTVRLNALRSDGGIASFNFEIETSPTPVVANFSASPTSAAVPATIVFSDQSSGSPQSWLWDFGDDDFTNSTLQNPVHTYTSAGTYSVSLKATNTLGSNTRTKTDYISVNNVGTSQEANTTITGLTISNCGGPQSVTVDTSLLSAALTPNTSVLVIQPPTNRGFENITLYALDGTGFSRNGNMITGHVTGVRLVTRDIAPTHRFSRDIGTTAVLQYSINLPTYPCNGILTTTIWQDMIPEYNVKFLQIVSANKAFSEGTAYTAEITTTNFPSTVPMTFFMSINSSWHPGGGRLFVWQILKNGNQGQILPTTWRSSDPSDNLYYLVANSTEGARVVGLCSLTGSNNPFQLITFAIQQAVAVNQAPANQANVAGGAGSAVQSQQITPAATVIPQTPAPPDPGQTGKIYSNANGVITQAMKLQSTDKLATVTAGEGIVAKDSTGHPLSSITIKAIPENDLPPASPGTDSSFAGLAYELFPEGATFSPSLTLTYIFPPNAPLGDDYTIKEFDATTGSWQDLPTRHDPTTGTVTADVSHFCYFALFARSTHPNMQSGAGGQTHQANNAAITPPSSPPPSNAMSIFGGMVWWAANLLSHNLLIFAGIVVLAVAIFLYIRKRRRDRWLKGI